MGKVSRTQRIMDEADKLLNTNWSDEDKELVSRIIDTLRTYKSVIPGFLKDDIRAILEMANRIKNEYDELAATIGCQDI